MLIKRNKKNNQLLLQRTHVNGGIAILGANCSTYRINRMINSTNGTCFKLDQSWFAHLRHRKRRLCWWSVSRGLRGTSSTQMLTRVLVRSRSIQSFTWHQHSYLHKSPLHQLSATASSWLVLALDGIYTCFFPRRNAQSVFIFPPTVRSRCKQANRLPSL